MFKPQAKSRWPGNIKRYQINSDGTITDANNNSAISETSGYFETNAQSWWSASADGDQVESGGFAAELNTDRVAYVYTGTAAPGDTALNTAEHLLSTTNEAITNLLMGLDSTTSDSVRNNLIQWALGIDVNGDDPADNYHNFVADPLHTKPVVITYGGTEDAPDDTVYGMTNMGFLHAIDTDDGTEIFSWIPKELLPNLNKYYTDSAAIGKTYGLDGHLTVWRQESNDTDVTIESAEGDHVYLYLGMRRGGNNYYALDVTSRTDPKLMWQINGGSGDFAALGQSWSKPQLATIPWDCNSEGKECSAKKVLIFAGGYDTKHDTATAPTTGDTGNAVFIVDALSGALLWSAGKATSHDLTLDDMENSIPSDVTVGDTNADGNIDFMFAVDILGHLWRFDINPKTQSASDFATGGMIADLSGSATTDFRRFYNSPDVAIFSSRNSAPFLSVAFGSGYRENPKNEAIQDRFYTLFYSDVFTAPTNEDGDIAYTALTDSDLLDATDTVANKSVNAPDGYYKNMSASGEKILSNSITFAGKTFFTSYLPQSTGSLCGVDIGGSRLYGLDLLTGEGIFTDGAEYMELKHGGIASDPAIIYTGDNTDGKSTTKPILCVGTECFADILDAGEILKKTYWREQ
jgi:type IV pilus assembly protein PilY1